MGDEDVTAPPYMAMSIIAMLNFIACPPSSMEAVHAAEYAAPSSAPPPAASSLTEFAAPANSGGFLF